MVQDFKEIEKNMLESQKSIGFLNTIKISKEIKK